MTTPPTSPQIVPTRPTPTAPRTLDSHALLGPRGEVWIAHHGQLYRLRETSQGKLILTK